VAATVFDRTLLRAGETVHMKHMIREHTGQGFRFVAAERLEKKVVLRHEGSEDRFEIPVAWTAAARPNRNGRFRRKQNREPIGYFL